MCAKWIRQGASWRLVTSRTRADGLACWPVREGIGPHTAAQLQRDGDVCTLQPALGLGQLVIGDAPVRAVAQFGHTLTVDQNQLCHNKALPKGAPTGLACCPLTPAHRAWFGPSVVPRDRRSMPAASQSQTPPFEGNGSPSNFVRKRNEIGLRLHPGNAIGKHMGSTAAQNPLHRTALPRDL